MAAEKKKKLLSIGIGAIVIVSLLILGYLFWRSQFAGAPVGPGLPNQEGPTEQATGSFEFRGPGYVEVEDPREATIIIVKGPGAKEARPITLTARNEGNTVWEGDISSEEPNCADDNTCSKSIEEINEEWDELEARDRYGNLFALFELLGSGGN